jgi:hypothetical protein
MLPHPYVGLVICHSYLWRYEADRRRDQGRKDRPCAILIAVEDESRDVVVTILPITHQQPAEPETAVEVPTATKRRLGLDGARSWIICTECNRFTWPGFDLTPKAPGGRVDYGPLPPKLLDRIRDKALRYIRENENSIIPRD